MDKKLITNAEFLVGVFRQLAQNEYIWTTAFVPSPNSNHASWAGGRAKPESCSDYEHGNAYFSVASFRGGNGRIKKNFSRLFCVVLDDAGGGDINPSWRIRTSENKVQIGFIFDEPITDIGIADRLHKALAKGGQINSDPSGNNVVRYVRLPNCINTKYEPAYRCSLEFFDPEQRYALTDLIKILGLSQEEIITPQSIDSIQPKKLDGNERIPDSEYISNIVSGENYHESILKLTARYTARGMTFHAISQTIKGFMGNAPDKGSERWINRYNDIDRTINGAISKFGKQERSLDHPLLRPYDYSTHKLRPVEFVIDGFIATGISMIAGEPGIGKSSMLVPLACCVAHLCAEDDPLKPTIKRKVFYVTEDTEQVERILYGLHKHVAPHLTDDEFKAGFMVIHAKRLNPSNLALEVNRVKSQYATQIGDFTARPLIVLDTANATLDIDNENDNAEVGKAISEIKQAADGMPIWIVAHTPKSINRQEVKDLTVRGASAFTGDTQATLFIFKDDKLTDYRFMMLGKHRFVEDFDEVRFSTSLYHQTIQTPWGKSQTQKYLVGKPEPASVKSRLEEKKALAEAQKAAEEFAIKLEILGHIRDADPDEPMTITRLKKLIPKRDEKKQEILNSLISDGKVIEKIMDTSGKRGRKPTILTIPLKDEDSVELATSNLPALGNEESDPDFIRIMGFDPALDSERKNTVKAKDDLTEI